MCLPHACSIFRYKISNKEKKQEPIKKSTEVYPRARSPRVSEAGLRPRIPRERLFSPRAKDFHSCDFASKQGSPTLRKQAVVSYTLGCGVSPVLGDMGTMACAGEARVLWATQLSLAVSEEGTWGAHKHLPLPPPQLLPHHPSCPPLSSRGKLTLRNPEVQSRMGGRAGKGTCCRILSCSCCIDIFISISFRLYPFSHWDLNLDLSFSSEKIAVHFCFKVCKLPTL